jgi:predicted RNA binding protein YcfA (HicA-like mRNA interferase family)
VSRWRRPLTAREVRAILLQLGFKHRDTTGGHEQWIRETPEPFRKVTLAAHNQPFAGRIVDYMARQAGVNVRAFYAALDR